MPICDLVGQNFGRLTVIELSEIRSSKSYWLCKCTCGKQAVVRSDGLRAGTKSCGCLSRDATSSRTKKHGLIDTPEYHAWENMRSRCNNTHFRQYHNYGGRGITVCERWESFENFLADVGPRPSDGHTLDRYPENDGNYEPGNVRWATRAEQQQNRSNTVHVVYCGERKPLTLWCEILGIEYDAVNMRLRNGWSVDRAFCKPVRSR